MSHAGPAPPPPPAPPICGFCPTAKQALGGMTRTEEMRSIETQGGLSHCLGSYHDGFGPRRRGGGRTLCSQPPEPCGSPSSGWASPSPRLTTCEHPGAVSQQQHTWRWRPPMHPTTSSRVGPGSCPGSCTPRTDNYAHLLIELKIVAPASSRDRAPRVSLPSLPPCPPTAQKLVARTSTLVPVARPPSHR
jgi:hypothetical protein